jgi:hypothetical protein
VHVETVTTGAAGLDVTLTARVTFNPSSVKFQDPPMEAPTGTVVIRLQDKECTATLSPISPMLNVAEGSCVVPGVTAGTALPVVAVYPGDENYQPLTENSTVNVVAPGSGAPAPAPAPTPAPTPTPTPAPTPAPTPSSARFPSTIVLSTNKPQGFTEGDDVAFLVTVDAPKAAGQFGPLPATPPTGTVTILFQNKQCAAVLMPPSPTPGPRGSCVIPNALAGEHWNVVAVYSGDANWRSSVSITELTVKPRANGAPPPAPPVIAPPPRSNVIITVIVNNIINTPGNTGATPGNNTGAGQPRAVDASVARFNMPTGIARDKKGNAYIADSDNFTIRKIARNGAVSTIAGTAGQRGNADGIGAAARFDSPSSLAADNAGNLYVLDNRNLRKIVLESGTVSTLVATPETSDGTTDAFLLPDGLAADTDGNVFVADYLLGVVWKVDSTGQVTRFAKTSEGFTDPTGSGPSGIAIDFSNNLYITDLPYNPNAGGVSAIRKIAPDGTITTVVEQNVGLVNTHGLAIDANGDFFVNENTLIVRINTDGTIVTYKLPISPAGGDVTAAGLATDSLGKRVYFTDAAKNTVNLLQTDGTIKVIAGSAGKTGSADAGQ